MTKVLVIDDEERFLRALANSLRARGFITEPGMGYRFQARR